MSAFLPCCAPFGQPDSVICGFEDVRSEFERVFHCKPTSLVFCPLPVQFGFSFLSFRAISNILAFSCLYSYSTTTFMSSRFPAQNFVLTNSGVIIAVSPVPESHTVYPLSCISISHLVPRRVLNTTLERLRKSSLPSPRRLLPLSYLWSLLFNPYLCSQSQIFRRYSHFRFYLASIVSLPAFFVD
jgi:hypothetical protein